MYHVHFMQKKGLETNFHLIQVDENQREDDIKHPDDQHESESDIVEITIIYEMNFEIYNVNKKLNKS